MKKGIGVLICLLLCMFMFSSCGKKSDGKMGQSFDKASTSTTKNSGVKEGNGGLEKVDPSNGGTSTKTESSSKEDISDRKVVIKATLMMDTKKFDTAINYINDTVTKDGGYIQSSNVTGGKSYTTSKVQNRTAEFVVRIPKDKLNAFLKNSEDFGVIRNKNVSGEDVTSQYFDTETRVKTLKVQEERLLSILAKSDKLQDIIELEKRLSEIRNEIESLTGTLKKLDNLIELTTVNITVNEVQNEDQLRDKPSNFGEKLSNTFKDSISMLISIFKGIIMVIVAIMPFVVVGAIVLIPSWFIVKKFKKR